MNTTPNPEEDLTRKLNAVDEAGEQRWGSEIWRGAIGSVRRTMEAAGVAFTPQQMKQIVDRADAAETFSNIGRNALLAEIQRGQDPHATPAEREAGEAAERIHNMLRSKEREGRGRR